MAYSTFRKFVNNRFPLINFKNETLENKPKKETLLYGKNETLVEAKQKKETLSGISSSPNISAKSDQQILR